MGRDTVEGGGAGEAFGAAGRDVRVMALECSTRGTLACVLSASCPESGICDSITGVDVVRLREDGGCGV